VLAQTVFAQTVFAQTVFAQTVFAQTVFAQTVFAQTVFAQTVFAQTVKCSLGPRAVVAERLVAFTHGRSPPDLLGTLDEVETFLGVASHAIEHETD
jgi:hypothetical protein